MKVSIIIPVYNVERYLDKCIESVIKQSYKELEIILINDGSKDSSRHICEKYAAIDKRIIFINQENMGASEARNIGLKISSGESILFVDSDDYINTNHVETLVNLMVDTQSDIAISSYKKINDNEECVFERETNVTACGFSRKEATVNMLLGKSFDTSVVCKLLKKDLVGQVRFNTKMSVAEDMIFYCEILKNADSIVFLDKKEYAYVQHKNNTMHTVSKKHIDSLDYIESFIKNEIDEDIKEALINKYVSTNFHFLRLTKEKDKRKILLRNISKYRSVLITGKLVTPKVRVACLLSYCFYR